MVSYTTDSGPAESVCLALVSAGNPGMNMKGIRFFLWFVMAWLGLAGHALAVDRTNDTLEINSLYREAEPFIGLPGSQADVLINRAWKKSIEISYQQGVADGYYYSAQSLEHRGKWAEAVDYYEKARSIYMLLDQISKLVDTHVRLAGIYAQKDQLFLAHRSYREAVRAAAGHTDSTMRWIANIRYAHFKNQVERDYLGALRMLDKIRQETAALAANPFEGQMNLVYSNSFLNLGNYGQARQYADRAEAYFRRTQDSAGIIRATLAHANILERMGDITGLRAKLDEAVALPFSLDSSATIWAEYQFLQIKWELRNEQYETALARGQALAENLRQRGNHYEMRKVVALMSMANYALGRIDDAAALFNRSHYLADSLLVEQFVQADAELSDKFILARQEDVDRLKLSNTIYQRYGLIVSVVVLLAILVILYIHFREKDKLANRVAIKNAEISVQNEILKQANIQNELLLREIHHRVKNNLQIINSLLSLQARKTVLPEVVEIMKESRSRLNSIALIHNKLYQQQSLSKLNIHEYIEQLAFHLLSLYNVNNNEIEVEVDARRVSLDIDTAIPLGLILTELITNSLKYAFVERNSGRITIVVASGDAKGYVLEYADDGVGMPESEFDVSKDSLGFKLIRSLTDQLDGDISYAYEAGLSKFVVHFRSHA